MVCMEELYKKVFKMGWVVKNSVIWQNLVAPFFTSREICMLVAEQMYPSYKKICDMFIMY